MGSHGSRPQIQSEIVDLATLRGAFSHEFERWDVAVGRADTELARQARAAIRAIAFQRLKVAPAAMGGFYLFCDSGFREGLGGLRYVGIADGSRRPIGQRIVDRLRDDSALDISLDTLPVEIARRRVHDRLVCALPASGQNYVDKHLRVAELFRCSPVVLLLGTTEPSPIIREAERVLIGAAAAAGAPLFNRQHLNFRGPASTRAVALVEAVIDEVSNCGVLEAGVRRWRDQISSMKPSLIS